MSEKGPLYSPIQVDSFDALKQERTKSGSGGVAYVENHLLPEEQEAVLSVFRLKTMRLLLGYIGWCTPFRKKSALEKRFATLYGFAKAYQRRADYQQILFGLSIIERELRDVEEHFGSTYIRTRPLYAGSMPWDGSAGDWHLDDLGTAGPDLYEDVLIRTFSGLTTQYKKHQNIPDGSTVLHWGPITHRTPPGKNRAALLLSFGAVPYGAEKKEE